MLHKLTIWRSRFVIQAVTWGRHGAVRLPDLKEQLSVSDLRADFPVDLCHPGFVTRIADLNRVG
jgi:hypothetical protein